MAILSVFLLLGNFVLIISFDISFDSGASSAGGGKCVALYFVCVHSPGQTICVVSYFRQACDDLQLTRTRQWQPFLCPKERIRVRTAVVVHLWQSVNLKLWQKQWSWLKQKPEVCAHKKINQIHNVLGCSYSCFWYDTPHKRLRCVAQQI